MSPSRRARTHWRDTPHVWFLLALFLITFVFVDAADGRKTFVPPYYNCDTAEENTAVGESTASCNLVTGALGVYATAWAGAAAAEATQNIWFVVEDPTQIDVDVEITRMGGKIAYGFAGFSGTRKVWVVNESRHTSVLDDVFGPNEALSLFIGFLGLAAPGSSVQSFQDAVEVVSLINDAYSLYSNFEAFEQAGDAERVTFGFSHTTTQANEIVDLWIGMRAEASGLLTGTGIGTSIGQLISVTVDGIDPPPPPTATFYTPLPCVDSDTYLRVRTTGNAEDVRYQFNWGDGTITPWSDFLPSSASYELTHPYTQPGTYQVEVWAQEEDFTTSDPLVVDIEVITAPTDPVPSIQVTNGTYCDQVDLQWGAVAGSEYYRVLEFDGFSWNDVSLRVFGTTWSHTGLGPGESHEYRVVPENKCGPGPQGGSIVGSTRAIPGPPSTLSASTMECDVELQWPPVPGASQHRVWRADVADFGQAIPIGVVDSCGGDCSYSDHPPAAATDYYYWVDAANTCGTGNHGPVAVGSRRGTPPQPSNVTASQSNCFGVRLDWERADLPYPLEYHVLRNGTYLVGPGQDAGITFYDETTVPGATYTYEIEACDVECSSGCSRKAVSGHHNTTPAVPQNIWATDGTLCERIWVNWLLSPWASRYHVYRDGELIDTVTGNTLSDSGIPAPAVVHQYAVAAENDCGTSAVSSSDGGHRGWEPTPVTGLTASDGLYCEKIHLDWEPVAHAIHYSVWRRRGPFHEFVASGITDTSFDDRGVTPSIPYEYWINTHTTCDSTSSPVEFGFADPDAASEPANIVASSEGQCPQVETGVTVAWEPIPAACYRVYRSSNPNPIDAVEIGSTCQATYFDEDTVLGEGAFYWVQAVLDQCISPLLTATHGIADGDADEDLICDSVDNCPLSPNYNQRDTDRDGEGNACEGVRFLHVRAEPTPFNPQTTIRFGLMTDDRVRIRIYDARGRCVRDLLDEHRSAGVHEDLVWNGTDDRGAAAHSGVYWLRLETGSGEAVVQKVLLLK